MKATAASVALLTAALFPSFGACVNPVVNLTYTSYNGTHLISGITQWLGMRYAAPPLGDLRFQPPQDPSSNDTVQDARKQGKVCLKTGDSPSSTTTAEDCLLIDVYAPSRATIDSKLPVYFFIQGGGFNSNSDPHLNGTGLIEASNHSIVFVTFNYRVGPYGFLTDGDQVTGNNGIRDQRKALQWVKQHITQFGGDPNHVVLGGDSAGAASISLHLIANGGKDEGLFHAAAAESVSFATVLTANQSRYQYDNFAIRLGCAAGNGTGTGHANTSSLACLRSKTAAELQAMNYNIPFPGAAAPPLYMWNPVIDNDLFTDLTYTAFEKGNFIKVPVIFGDDTNGGTVFAPSNTSTLAESNQFLKDQFPYLTLDQLAKLNQLYPNPSNCASGTAGCYWRQLSNVYGEMRYMCPGLYINSMFIRYGINASYAYRWNVEDPDQMARGLGVPHTVEVSAIFGPYNVKGNAPASYYPNGTNAEAVPVVQGYWTSFIRSFDPNSYRLSGTAEWVPWSSRPRQRLRFDAGGNTTMETIDDGLKDRCDYLNSIGPSIRQ
ncbi:Alpha/Beta hydrolase protein [Diplogelasinospora grovesii]|uniref:Carboxylic ester hydrolase n=1 Tax=Diplogelasinospora grovesii TaxID=303347 RepID=A0AAN6N3X8_9PEZI|nr:Alpha/Beta hydrolase protein [Diplogelasinospora grovesii]